MNNPRFTLYIHQIDYHPILTWKEAKSFIFTFSQSDLHEKKDKEIIASYKVSLQQWRVYTQTGLNLHYFI